MSAVTATVMAAVLACSSSADTVADRAPGSAASVVRDSEVVVAADSGRVLAGTYTRPGTGAGEPGRASRRAVLLLGGSGPQDRDGARADLPGYQPLRDLAETLARSGLAVLRLDDRGVGGSTGRFEGATTYDFAADAARALAWLRGRPDVEHIALVGHSEGALVAMLVAGRDRDVDALVLMGAPSRPGREVARWQRAALVTGDSTTWPVGERDAVLAAADSNAEHAAARDPWLRAWFALDPREVARAVRVPVLLLHGTADRQVPSEQADELAAALRASAEGDGDVTVRRFPSTNHLFLEDGAGDPRRYAQLPSRRIRGDVARAIADWLRRHEHP